MAPSGGQHSYRRNDTTQSVSTSARSSSFRVPGGSSTSDSVQSQIYWELLFWHLISGGKCHRSQIFLSPFRYMLALSIVPAVVQFIGFIFLPESPRWLLQKGRTQEARDVLSRIRGDQSVDVEYETIKTSIEEEKREAGGGERSH